MFRKIATTTNEANKLFSQHPSVVTSLLELAWKNRQHVSAMSQGHPDHRSDLPQSPDFWLNTTSYTIPSPIIWDHLIYAYMIENTRIYEIFRRVIREYLHGEKLGVPVEFAQHWLRNTEELFYRTPRAGSLLALDSSVRPDMGATRRNAYWRMFAMDLNHGDEENRPYAYAKADAANSGFVSVFEELLREVWIAIVNKNNNSGANPTDRDKIGSHARSLNEMLLSRRLNGNLSREEFAAVSMMSWFHLTIQYNSPIVETLRATAVSPEQRLFKIAQRVGIAAHGYSGNYFEIADHISPILILIESGALNSIPSTGAPFAPNVEASLSSVITHWSVITGHDMKAGKVRAS